MVMHNKISLKTKEGKLYQSKNISIVKHNDCAQILSLNSDNKILKWNIKRKKNESIYPKD